MGLKDMKSKYGYPSGRPDGFDLGRASTLHNESSTINKPAFSAYKNPYLRTLKPVDKAFLFPKNPKEYLKNLPG